MFVSLLLCSCSTAQSDDGPVEPATTEVSANGKTRQDEAPPDVSASSTVPLVSSSQNDAGHGGASSDASTLPTSDAAASTTVLPDASGTTPDASGTTPDATSPSSTTDANPDSGAVPSSAATASSAPLVDDTDTGEQRFTCDQTPNIVALNISNARDLGAVATATGTTSCGMLFRGPPLAELTETQCTEFANLGIRTVIDLRIESEITTRPDAACVTDLATVVLAPLPVPVNVSAENYLTDLNTLDSMAMVFHTLGDPAAYPVYMHCTFGRDRTGVVAAAVLLALGAAPDAVLAEYMLSEESVGAYPESLQAVLDDIALRGGAAAYLAELGISEGEVDVLRAKLASGV